MIRLSEAIRTAQAAALVDTVTGSPTIVIYTGDAPDSILSAASGTLLASASLLVPWATSSGPVITVPGPLTLIAQNDGLAGYYRIYVGSTCHVQGSVGTGYQEADLIVGTTQFTLGRKVIIESIRLTVGNA